ncbi:MAG TPA: hypothetical protein VFN66_02400, partial [Burkholderiales bacterium]|nr:hypothetical protein [Burkholderiales bacterium]
MELNQSQDNKQAAPRWVSFKYRSGSAALRCLSDGLAYFAKPSEFNDCLEAKFDHSSAVDYIECMDRSIRSVAEQRGCAGGYEVPEGELASFEAKTPAIMQTSWKRLSESVSIRRRAGQTTNPC